MSTQNDANRILAQVFRNTRLGKQYTSIAQAVREASAELGMAEANTRAVQREIRWRLRAAHFRSRGV